MNDYKNLSDIELVNLLKKDDHLAFTEILKRYSGILINFAYRRVADLQLAEDIVYEVWATFWEKRNNLIFGKTILPFLFTIIKNRILDHFRRQKVTKKYIDSFQTFLVEEENNSDHLIRQHELSALIEKEILNLPENMRIVFELHRNENKSRKEIAQILNMPENSVKSNMQRALKVLRYRLGNSFSLIFL